MLHVRMLTSYPILQPTSATWDARFLWLIKVVQLVAIQCRAHSVRMLD